MMMCGWASLTSAAVAFSASGSKLSSITMSHPADAYDEGEATHMRTGARLTGREARHIDSTVPFLLGTPPVSTSAMPLGPTLEHRLNTIQCRSCHTGGGTVCALDLPPRGPLPLSGTPPRSCKRSRPPPSPSQLPW